MMIGLAFSTLAAQASASSFEPTSSYTRRTIEHFTVMVSAKLKSPDAVLNPAIQLLRVKLHEIDQMVPSKQLKVMQKVTIWMELNNPDIPCACYHPDAGWLKEHHYNPSKVKCVEISNSKTFVDWVKLNQPLMILHELAHGYHDLSFGYADGYIKACYDNAMANHLYDLVDYNLGGKRKGYATTNPMEYFAELSEAWFNGNDFFPFNREELKAHDTAGYELMRRTWNP